MIGSPFSNRQGESAKPTVISLGQVWVDIMMGVDDFPSSGQFAVAKKTSPAVGGSYRILQASSRMGAHTQHAGIVGNGLWAEVIRDAFREDDIEHIGPDRIDADSGFRLVFNDGNHKTFIANYGAETQGNASVFDSIPLEDANVVHISGNSLMDHTAAGVDEFVCRAGTNPDDRPYHLVINPTNTLQLVNDHLLEDLVLARPVWSCNRQEAMTLANRLGVYVDDSLTLKVNGGFDDFMAALCEALGSTLRAPLIVRAGSRGAWVRTPGGEVVHVEGFPTKSTHTRSAGACHTGAMCALLAEGWSLVDSVRIANAAASLAIQNNIDGVPNCPSYAQAMELVNAADA